MDNIRFKSSHHHSEMILIQLSKQNQKENKSWCRVRQCSAMSCVLNNLSKQLSVQLSAQSHSQFLNAQFTLSSN